MGIVAVISATAATIVLTWAIAYAEAPAIRAVLLAGGAAEHRLFKILLPILAIAAVSLPAWFPIPTQERIITIAGGASATDLLETAIIAAFTVLLCSQLTRFASPVLAVTAAILGRMAAAGDLSRQTALITAGAWLAAPFTAAVLAFIIFKAADRFVHRRNTHLLRLDNATKALYRIAAILLTAAAAFNAAPLIAATACSISGTGALAAGICALAALSGYAVFFNTIRLRSWEFADRELEMSAPALIAVTFSSAIVLALSPVPLSACLLVICAMAGVSLTGVEALLDADTARHGIIGAVASIAIGFLLGFGFNPADDLASLAIVLILLGIVLAIILYRNSQTERDLQKSIIRSREKQIDSNRRSLTALEVRSEMVEKDLEAKLDGKRRELVDFALGIGDQKRYMEGIYEELQEVREAADGRERERRLDAMLESLRERMYFTREMNDFYAQSEILHKDFNMRLRERFPDLTENERKLANLLRQGFSSKHIASLMSITPKSVEINRYRLRAKLGLQRSDNLINFIKSI